MSEKKGGSCSGSCMGCFLGVLAVGFIAGAYLYIQVPKWMEKADKELVPYIESKGRAIVGALYLEPLHETIEASDLSDDLKTDWRKYLDDKWELAHGSRDKELAREDIIDASREVVVSYSGYYYALKAIEDQGLEDTALNPKQQRKAKHLLKTTRENMEEGVYSITELEPLESNIYSVVSGWRISTENRKGKWEEDKNYRDLFRALSKLNKEKVHHGLHEPRNMKQEFLDELEKFRATIEAAEEEAQDFHKSLEAAEAKYAE